MATYTNKNGTNEADTLTYNKAGTYYAYNGNDTIKVTGGSVVVYTGKGNNIITVTGGSNHTINTDKDNATSDTIAGTDTLTINGANSVEAYLGSGRDAITLNTTDGRKSTGASSAIHGGAWTDTFTVNSGSQRYQLYGDAGDDSFKISGGSNIVCWGGAANDTFEVTGGTGIKLRGGDSADVYNISTDGVDMQLGYGNDVVNVTDGDNQKIKANLGINTINLKSGSGHVITADIDQVASKKAGKDVGYGQDKVVITNADSVTANLGDGKDVVEISGGYDHIIYTEGWGDTITVTEWVKGCHLDAGDGDDTINLDTFGANEVRAGSGNDVLNVTLDTYYLYGRAETKNAYSKLSGGSGNDKFNFSDSKLWRVQKGVIAFGGSGNDVFDMDCGDVIAFGGNGNDIFYNYTAKRAYNNYLVGGAGNDAYCFDLSTPMSYKNNIFNIDNQMYHTDRDRDRLQITDFEGSISDISLEMYDKGQKDYRRLVLKDSNGQECQIHIQGFSLLTQILIRYKGDTTWTDYGTGAKFERTLANLGQTESVGISSMDWTYVYPTYYSESTAASYGSLDDFINNDPDLKIYGNGREVTKYS